jgi:hypothetical protein
LPCSKSVTVGVSAHEPRLYKALRQLPTHHIAAHDSRGPLHLAGTCHVRLRMRSARLSKAAPPAIALGEGLPSPVVHIVIVSTTPVMSVMSATPEQCSLATAVARGIPRRPIKAVEQSRRQGCVVIMSTVEPTSWRHYRRPGRPSSSCTPERREMCHRPHSCYVSPVCLTSLLY